MRLATLTFLLVLLTGCSTMKLDDFAGTGPRLVLEDYFLGHTRAWGLFEDRFGNIRRQFVVDIDGTMEGDELVLVEDFVYDDGETDQRIWRIRRTGDDAYEGRAGDVVGVARGRVAGRALNWSYEVDLPIGERTWRVRFDDWMLLQDEEVLLNRATVSKWGITLGEVTIFFRRDSGPEREAATQQPQHAAEHR
jgi:hypothetical protein